MPDSIDFKALIENNTKKRLARRATTARPQIFTWSTNKCGLSDEFYK